jgi:hypothetical protein
LLPLILSDLTEGLERGLALELKGFSRTGTRTFFIELQQPQAELWVARIVLLFFSTVAVWEVVKWFNQ